MRESLEMYLKRNNAISEPNLKQKHVRCAQTLFCFFDTLSFWGSRRCDPLGAVIMSIFGIHTFCETSRLAIILMGCATNKGEYTFVASIVLSWVLNIGGRTCYRAYAGWWLSQFTGKGVFTPLCSTSFLRELHQDLKFSGGWPRFACALAVIKGRGALHGNIALSNPLNDPTFWCWNETVLVALLGSAFAELVEDSIAHYAINFHPVPPSISASTLLTRSRESHNRFHPLHLGFLQVSSVDSNDRGAPYGMTNTTQGSRGSQRVGRGRASGDALGLVELAPTFQQLRVLSISETNAILNADGGLFIILMCTGLGKDYFTGYCDPASDPLIMLQSLFVWHIDTSCVESESGEVGLASLSTMVDIGVSFACIFICFFGLTCWILRRPRLNRQNATQGEGDGELKQANDLQTEEKHEHGRRSHETETIGPRMKTFV